MGKLSRWFEDHPFIAVVVAGWLLAEAITNWTTTCIWYTAARRDAAEAARQASEGLGG